MKYRNISQGRFIERPNRFIAYVEINGRKETVHVKNTGRCLELLVPGAKVYVQESENPERKTKWDLIAVEKNEKLINMDSQIPNQTVKELTQRRSKRKQDDLLYQKAVCYNRKIFKEKQAGLKDVFSYRSAPIVLRNEKNTFGYIKIPKMKQKLPLYLGATMENMRKGAAIMGQTSLPVGQKDSNCVIAAHRGYRGIPYFRDIEQLKTGDQVIIRNPWERLDYRVTKIKVIDPYDMDKILIQKEKDMVTLLTCHPYRGHGRYRYVVYCMRNHGQKIRKQKEDR